MEHGSEPQRLHPITRHLLHSLVSHQTNVLSLFSRVLQPARRLPLDWCSYATWAGGGEVSRVPLFRCVLNCGFVSRRMISGSSRDPSDTLQTFRGTGSFRLTELQRRTGSCAPNSGWVPQTHGSSILGPETKPFKNPCATLITAAVLCGSSSEQ